MGDRKRNAGSVRSVKLSFAVINQGPPRCQGRDAAQRRHDPGEGEPATTPEVHPRFPQVLRRSYPLKLAKNPHSWPKSPRTPLAVS